MNNLKNIQRTILYLLNIHNTIKLLQLKSSPKNYF